jgi:cellulose synthase/poly-beta-1,6-N-acetylglucosamine synthase-like glycosyltransferase
MNLNTPEYLYLGAVACYLLFFALFLRLFWWKRYAERHYWHRRPHLSLDGMVQKARSQGQALPRMTLIIPARNEADVIERTVDHITSLQYPRDRYEVVVVTDEKEALAADDERRRATEVAARAIREGDWSCLSLERKAGALVMASLGAIALEGWDEVDRKLGETEGLHLLRAIPDPLLRPILWEAADLLLQRSGRRVAPHLSRLLRLRLPQATDEELQAAYAALLSLAIPSAVAYCRLTGGDGHALGARLAAYAAQAHQRLTREIVQSMCDSLAADLIGRLEALGTEDRLAERLAGTYREVFPTTQDIMERKLRELSARDDAPQVRHLVVPHDFDGAMNGKCLGVPVPSTKGRALNWALTHLDGRSAWCGFFDAESRPHPQVMLYVAYRVLEAQAAGRTAPRLFQGPVFQIRNWYEMGPFCKVASLYQTVAHEWALPVVFRRLPFVSGTNLFVEAALIKEIGGYDPTSLTEDLELGTRAYLKAGAWPEYLPYPSSEQTPPTFLGFYRQRLRWATGHLQVMVKVRREQGYDATKKRRLLRALWLKGQGEWLFYQFATFVPPVTITLWLLGKVNPNVLPGGWSLLLHLLSACYLAFTLYTLWRYFDHLDTTGRPRRWLGQLGAVSQLLVLPLAAFLFPVPYSSAMLLSSLGRGPAHWVKTPRTRE